MFESVYDRQSLLFEIKLLRDRVDAFESGKQYVLMEKQHSIARDGDARMIRRLKKRLEEERREKVRVRENWFQICLDIEAESNRKIKELKKEHAREIRKKDERICELEEALQKEKDLRKEEHEKYLKQLGEAYQAKTELEEEKEKNQALTARIKKDFSNSSKSSSMSPNHKTIHNSREKTGRKPGGQPGHVHHGRKRQEATEIRKIPAPAKYAEDPAYKPTGKIVSKQLIKVHVITEVIEYQTPEFRNVATGQRVHADFPPGIVDDVNYDGTVKALAYMINNDLYTSIEKTRVFLKEISKGKIDISTGFICSLSRQFSDLTKEERAAIYKGLMTSDVLHSDFSFGRAAGKQSAVIITADDDGRVLYQGRRKKGDEGVKGSPVEHYDGTVVSDHEATFLKRGSRRQECLAHLLRYAKGAAENEPVKTWAVSLDAWIRESVGYWNEVDSGLTDYDKKTAEVYIKRFKEIIRTAKEEYDYEPPSKYYKEGYNTYKRMEEKPEDYVLFLRDPSVPPTNNLAERLARQFKRKCHQVMSFRSEEGFDRFCDGLSVMASIKSKGENLFEVMTEIFNQNITEW